MKTRFLLLTLLLVISLIGCGPSSSGTPQSIATDAQVQDMVKARAIFEASADRNFDSLPADKKAEYTKLVNATDEAGARRWWGTMAGPGGAGTSSPGSANMTIGPR